jgi:hypothetical protein
LYCLKDYVKEADGIDVDLPQRHAIVKKTVKKIYYHLQHISGLWKVILPLHIYFLAMGKLVGGLCGFLSDAILLLDDIAEVESERLAQLLSFEEIESLFLAEKKSFVAHYAGSSYLKFKTLIQLLTWSFSSIMEQFRMGALIDFSIPELTHLCKALFSDTPLRQANIAEIEKGHPT